MMKFFSKITAFILSLTIYLPIVAFADAGTFDNPFTVQTVQDLLLTILEILMRIGTPLAAAMIIWAGFLYVTSSGNTNRLSKAHATLLWAVVGTCILIGAKLIAMILQNTVSQIAK